MYLSITLWVSYSLIETKTEAKALKYNIILASHRAGEQQQVAGFTWLVCIEKPLCSLLDLNPPATRTDRSLAE